MCGIVGVASQAPVNQLLYDALLLLQHRGQDAAGIATQEQHRFYIQKAKGMVRDVFRTRNMRALPGTMGIGQVRYPTAGNADNEAEAQPFYVNAPYGIVLTHNGNLINAHALQQDMVQHDHRHINTDSDSEVLLNVLAHELAGACASVGAFQIEALFKAVSRVHERVKGSYAVIAMIAGQGLLAFRDPYGIRPLCMGKNNEAYMFASESVALEGTGHPLVRDIDPGEAVFIDMQGNMHARQCAPSTQKIPCIFEYVYLARPDSVIDGISVYQARLHLGKTLAQSVLSCLNANDIDAVIPIPESSRPSALELAHYIQKPYREGFVKNRYVGRTFIMPGQAIRQKSVRQKLSLIEAEFKDRNVLLVDDSIVRGTTSGEIVQMAREAGARKVYLASAAPPVRYPNVYGIDMPSVNDLVAYQKTIDQIQALIGCDALIYQDVEAMKQTILALAPSDIQSFEASCFDGHYCTGDVTLQDVLRINADRNKPHFEKQE